MPKHVEKIMVYDEKTRADRGAYLEIEAPQDILDALLHGRLSYDVLANLTYGQAGNACVIKAKVVVMTRDGKRKR